MSHQRAAERQVLALSRGDAEKLPRLPSIAIISVTAPHRSDRLPTSMASPTCYA